LTVLADTAILVSECHAAVPAMKIEEMEGRFELDDGEELDCGIELLDQCKELHL
jgi:hypothetical protein